MSRPGLTSLLLYSRLVLGDIILSVNSKRITSASDLYRILDKCAVGDKVRSGALHCCCIVLGAQQLQLSMVEFPLLLQVCSDHLYVVFGTCTVSTCCWFECLLPLCCR